jgi:hypothetical protein
MPLNHSFFSKYSKLILCQILLCLLVFGLGCSQKNKKTDSFLVPTMKPLESYSHEGEIRDLKGLDGCHWMIITPSGKKLQVVSWPGRPPQLTHGQKINFTYEIETDVVSICMAEDENIKVLTYEFMPMSKPGKEDCKYIQDPFRVKWMEKLIEKHKPYSIVRYDYLDGWAYFLQSGTISNFYDCQGTFLCDVPGKVFNDCMDLISTLENAEVIWVMNEKKD